MDVHPDSVLRTKTGRVVALKVHRCLWSGQHAENSLAALDECLAAPVARAEIDIAMLADHDFLVMHDTPGLTVSELTCDQASRLELASPSGPYRPPLLSEVVAHVAARHAPTRIELDMMDLAPLPWPRVEELVELVAPARERLVFNNMADWNLRRLLHIDPTLQIGFDPAAYLDWLPPAEEAEQQIRLARGAYGYFDDHQLAAARLTSTADYLFDRLGGILRQVPAAREVHLRVSAFERMLEDGASGIVDQVHAHGAVLDVWTLDADTPDWRARLARAVEAGVDIVTTNTPRELSRAG